MQFEELLCILRCDYPDLVFRSGKKFTFRPPRMIIFEQNLDRIAGEVLLGQDAPELDGGAVRNAPELDDAEGSAVHNNYCLQLLHEVGHARLQHRDFGTDLERVKMECAAWREARELCGIYNIYYDEEFVEEELDTYRDWLHRQSRCRECGLTRYQTADGVYHCPRCEDLLGR